MRSPLPDSLHIFNVISGTPTATTIQGLPNSSSVVWTWPLLWPYDLSPFISHLHPHYTSPRRHEDVSVWSVCFCLIKGISPTVSCGDLIKNCILFLAILPVLLIAIVKRADKIGRMSPKIMQAWFNLAPPVQALHSTCANLTSKLWLWLQRLLHIINICILCVILYCFILYYLFKLRFSVFERRTEVYLLCWLAVWEAPDVAIEFKPPSASDGFKAVICEPCVHECVCAADAHWVGVAFVWWGQRFHCMWYTGGAAELVQTQMLMFNIILSVIKYVYTVGQLNVIVFFYLYLTVSALLYLNWYCP